MWNIWYTDAPIPTLAAEYQSALWTFSASAGVFGVVALLMAAQSRGYPAVLLTRDLCGCRLALVAIGLAGVLTYVGDPSAPQLLPLRIASWLVAPLALLALIYLVLEWRGCHTLAHARCARCGYAQAPEEDASDAPRCAECGAWRARVGVIQAGVSATPLSAAPLHAPLLLSTASVSFLAIALVFACVPTPQLNVLEVFNSTRSANAAGAVVLRSRLGLAEYAPFVTTEAALQVDAELAVANGSPRPPGNRVIELPTSQTTQDTVIAFDARLVVSGPPGTPELTFRVRRARAGEAVRVRIGEEWLAPHQDRFEPHFRAHWPPGFADTGAQLAARNVFEYASYGLPVPAVPPNYAHGVRVLPVHHAIVMPGWWWWLVAASVAFGAASIHRRALRGVRSAVSS